ncbi:MAG: hypothetical protein FWG03_00445 [Clostridiales bacterium]|nr:hypothetical protein [Clostridiales bacterium]
MVDWKVILSAILLVVVLIVALNLRSKISRNKDSEAGIFRPYRLNVEGDEVEDEEDEERGDDYDDDEGEEEEDEED